MSKSSSRDRTEGATDEVTGRAKEAGGSPPATRTRRQRRADQDKGALKKKKGAVKGLLK